jgi:predicted small secreted protein
MNKKSFTRAVIIGIALGVLVLHPLWVSVHAFDGQHEDSSWLDFVVLAYRQSLSFKDIGHTFLSVVAGILVSVFVLMIKARKKRNNVNYDG